MPGKPPHSAGSSSAAPLQVPQRSGLIGTDLSPGAPCSDRRCQMRAQYRSVASNVAARLWKPIRPDLYLAWPRASLISSTSKPLPPIALPQALRAAPHPSRRANETDRQPLHLTRLSHQICAAKKPKRRYALALASVPAFPDIARAVRPRRQTAFVWSEVFDVSALPSWPICRRLRFRSKSQASPRPCP